ASDENMETM
nr:Chain I, NP-N3D peptide [synthetic construct]4L8C_J Chain J, NP-N3D peptide [synthetic construct]4L8C_K Chain K, NP-N3D peptide [synthetic construct]4L8C_L Chain L, NP-N3D peptide [synthetic construct]